MSEFIKAAQAVVIALGTAAITAYTTISLKNVEIAEAKTARAAEAQTDQQPRTPVAVKPAEPLTAEPAAPPTPAPFTVPNVAFKVLALKSGVLSVTTCQSVVNAALVAAKAEITDTNETSNFFELGDARGFIWCAINVDNISPQVFLGVYGPDGLDTFASRDRVSALIEPPLSNYLAD